MRTANITMAPVTPKVAKLLHALQAELLTIPEGSIPPDSIVLQPVPHNLRSEYRDFPDSRWLKIMSPGYNYSATFTTPYITPDWGWAHSCRPGRWICEEERRDTNGDTWRRTTGYFVQDDFGTLVKVVR